MTTCAAKRTYGGIDLAKLIASVLVVLLHSVETSSWYPCEVKFIFTRMAVPFFFIASGFFFYQSLSNAENKRSYFLHYERRLLLLFAVWALLIYFPFELRTYRAKYPEAGLIQMGLYLFRRTFIIGPGPYWYLVSLVWAAAFLYLCSYAKKDFLLYIAVFLGLFLEISYSCFRGFLSSLVPFRIFFQTVDYVYSWEYNFFMFGIPFMGIGCLLNKYRIKWKTSLSFLLLGISTLLRLFEYNLPVLFPSEFWSTNAISIAFIPQAISLFLLAKELKINIDRSTSLCLRQLSSCIYFSHAIFLYELLDPLLVRIMGNDAYADYMIVPKIIATLVFCLILFFIIKKANKKYLNILING